MKQVPILQAHALTSHKSQGQSLSSVAVCGFEKCRQSECLYVAVSRARSYKKIAIVGKLAKKPFKQSPSTKAEYKRLAVIEVETLKKVRILLEEFKKCPSN